MTRTERLVDAALMCVQYARESAREEGLESRVGRQLHEAERSLGGAYATLVPDEDGR